MLLSLFGFVFRSGQVFLRFSFILLPISLIIAIGINKLFILIRSGWNFAKIVTFVGCLFLMYGVFKNDFDFWNRSQVWLDNRPIAYDFFYKTIKKIDDNDYDTAYVTSIFGDSQKYCFYYLGDKCNKFIFSSFDLVNKESIEKKTIYAGMSGEFLGPDVKNDVSNDFGTVGVEILAKKEIRDNIAYKYGNYLLIGLSK